MARQVHRAALVRLLQQLAPMQRALGDQRVVVLAREAPRAVQRAGEHADRLELRLGVANDLLVDGERLREEVVRQLRVARLVCDARAGDEKAQRHVVEAVDPCIQARQHAPDLPASCTATRSASSSCRRGARAP